MKINKDEMREKILNTWVQFEGIMRMLMISDELTHQEVCICNLIANSSEPVTATELCEKLSVHKSQMNRTLNRLEKEKVIIRERSESDRRMVYIRLNEEHLGGYVKLHEKSLAIVDAVSEKLGVERVAEINHVLRELIGAFEEVASEGDRKGS